jgi:2-hydroxy-6-oxonona-2,4-dienedioate hydrolase
MLLRSIVIACLVAVVVMVAFAALDLRRAYARLEGRSEVAHLASGNIEFTRGGSGIPVLVIHGSGGGFDQGQLIAQAVLGEAFQWIAPSRMGYLRSTLRDGATFEDQAHAYAALLDHLQLDRVAVVALSHGGPSALLFAALYPERVTSLTLLSCGVATSAEADQQAANRKGNALTMIFRYDLLYWTASRFMRNRLLSVMGANAETIAQMSPVQRELITRLIDEMNPVAPRYPGVALDNRAALPNEQVAAIRAPTLVIHARDDALQLYHNAEYAATHIPNAELMAYDRGGHFLVAVELPAIQAAVRRFIGRGQTPTRD